MKKKVFRIDSDGFNGAWYPAPGKSSRLHADGAKNDPFYEPKNELMKLGLPEHLILWPVLFCPAVGFIAAGIGMLIR
jgi:hypothetical protein